MKTNGYALREAIKQQTLRQETAFRAFSGSLKAFPGETKPHPNEIMETYVRAEKAVAKLQIAQMRYNLMVQVTVTGEQMALGEAIKRVGGVARAEKLWRSATGPKPDRYGRDEDERDPSKIIAAPTVAVTEAVARASQMARQAGALREAIATGNAREVEIEDLDASLFE